MIPFVDIHTHFPKSKENVISIQNFTQNEWENLFNTVMPKRDEAKGIMEARNPEDMGKGGDFASVGLHPWYLTKENAEKDLEKMVELIDKQNIIAIGECGLDKLKGESFDFQTDIFAKQIQLAESVRKPVIIHCVRAFNEVISLKKKLKPSIPLVIHGFNKNEAILTELLKNGFYISIGATLSLRGTTPTARNEAELRGDNNFKNTVLQIPTERLFFETDDKDMDIQQVYDAYCDAADMDLIDLKSIIYNNFKSILSKHSLNL